MDCCLLVKVTIEYFPVAMRLGETPVHIPNTMVKAQTADDTMLVTAWESRWLPDFFERITDCFPEAPRGVMDKKGERCLYNWLFYQ